jgi:hypothetical protein
VARVVRPTRARVTTPQSAPSKRPGTRTLRSRDERAATKGEDAGAGVDVRPRVVVAPAPTWVFAPSLASLRACERTFAGSYSSLIAAPFPSSYGAER